MMTQRTDTLKIWQQNVNRSLISQLDLVNNLHPRSADIVDIQEPYFDHLQNTRENSRWYVVYPQGYKEAEKAPRSVMLVSKAISTNSWVPLQVGTTDVTAIRMIATGNGIPDILIYNVYVDQANSDTITAIDQHTTEMR